MMKNLGWLLLIGFVFLLVAYQQGYLKRIPKLPKNEIIDNVEFTDKCMRKKIGREYRLAISFEKSDNKSYERGLEIFYDINIEKQDCSINGTGYKTSDISTDSIGHKIHNNYKPNAFPITIVGNISEDTIRLYVSKKTDSNRDNKVTVDLFFEHDTIKEYISGKFDETVTNGKGKAKLSTKKR